MEHCLKNITFEGIRLTYKNSYFLKSFHTLFFTAQKWFCSGEGDI
jgi:hypothetical protein